MLNKSFMDVRNEAYAVKKLRTDFYVYDVACNFTVDYKYNFHFVCGDDSGNEVERVYRATEWSMAQLCRSLNINPDYIQKCYDSGLERLGAMNVNSWLEKKPESKRGRTGYLIRTIDGMADACLSSKFCICDSVDLLDIVAESININAYDIEYSALTRQNLYLAMAQKTSIEAAGKELYPELVIRTSDIGSAAVDVSVAIKDRETNADFYINKVIGLEEGIDRTGLSGTLYHKRHFGIVRDERLTVQESVERILCPNLERLPNLLNNAIDVINEASRKRIDFTDDNTRQLYIAKLKKGSVINEKAAEDIIQTLSYRKNTTLWDLVIETAVYANKLDIESKADCMAIAGNLL